MKTLIQLFIILLINIPSLIYTSEKLAIERLSLGQYRIGCTEVYHPKTGAIIPGYTRSEFHQCSGVTESGTTRPSARIIVYQRTDGSIVSEELILYPSEDVSNILDAFSKAPQHTIKYPTLVIKAYMEAQKPDSEEECRARLAIYQTLFPHMPKEATTITTWEKQRKIAQRTADELAQRAKENPRYQVAALKAQGAADLFQNKLNLTYTGFGSIKYTKPEQRLHAIALGEQVVFIKNQTLPKIELK